MLSVYAAGFNRTRAIAESLDAQDTARRRPIASAPLQHGDAGTVVPAAANTAPRPDSPQSIGPEDITGQPQATRQTASGTSNSPRADSVAGKKQLDETLSREVPAERTDMVTQTFGAETSLQKAPTVVAGTSVRQESSLGQAELTAPTKIVAVNPSIIAAPSAPAPVPAPPAAKPVATAAPKAAAPAAKAADSVPAPAGWQDGTYIGYGASRHGDVESTVMVEKGKIVAAAISRCLTQYSCSWIAHLQQQVVTRQSPDVDNVSGATHSANAFYYSVIDALNKAK